MPLLSGNTTENFGISLAGTGTVSWVLSAISALNPLQQGEGVSAQGVIAAAGVSIIPSSFSGNPHGPASRELQFFSAINLGTSSNVVTLGKVVVLPGAPNTFFQFSPPALLQGGESLIYVKDAGFQVYDSLGLKKEECCGTSTGLGPATGAVAALAFQTVSQSIPNTTNTAVKLDTLGFEAPATMYSAGAPTQLMAPQAGLYRVTANVLWPVAGANALAELWFQVNGAATQYGRTEGHISAIAGVLTSMMADFLFNLNAGDYVEAYVWQNNGGALVLNPDAGTTTYFSMALVR